MFKNPLLLIALALTGAVAVWGILDTSGLANFASTTVGATFTSRGWFIMLTASFLLIVCIWLALSPYGQLKLGHAEDEPEFSTVSWLTMLFAAGMGVGLLYFGTAEPISHYITISDYVRQHSASGMALFITDFHWGLHAWAMYAIVGLAIAYFGFRQSCPTLISAPIQKVFGDHGWPRVVGWLSDLLAIYAIAIGMGGAIAMGVFQIQSGVESLLSTQGDLNPSVKTKLIWGIILAALGLVMILSNSIDAVKSIIALGAMPFVFIVLLVTVCLLKALKSEVV